MRRRQPPLAASLEEDYRSYPVPVNRGEAVDAVDAPLDVGVQVDM